MDWGDYEDGTRTCPHCNAVWHSCDEDFPDYQVRDSLRVEGDTLVRCYAFAFEYDREAPEGMRESATFHALHHGSIKVHAADGVVRGAMLRWAPTNPDTGRFEPPWLDIKVRWDAEAEALFFVEEVTP